MDIWNIIVYFFAPPQSKVPKVITEPNNQSLEIILVAGWTFNLTSTQNQSIKIVLLIPSPFSAKFYIEKLVPHVACNEFTFTVLFNLTPAKGWESSLATSKHNRSTHF